MLEVLLWTPLPCSQGHLLAFDLRTGWRGSILGNGSTRDLPRLALGIVGARTLIRPLPLPIFDLNIFFLWCLDSILLLFS